MLAIQVAHEVVQVTSQLTRSRPSHGNGYATYVIGRWLWHFFGWWTLLIAGGVTFAWAMVKRALGISDD